MPNINATNAINHLRQNPADLCALLVFFAAAYLMLWNLGYAPLWHDESALANPAKKLLANGSYYAWDGQNLYLGHTDKGSAVNNDLFIVLPPWPALPSALGLLLFDDAHTGIRFFHALLGVLALPLLWALLKMDFPRRPRLCAIAFALFALSAQVILFARIGRYAPDAIFFSLALFYFYRLFLRDGRGVWIILAAGAAALNFFNQYAIGVSTAVAVACWHLIFHARRTTLKQWLCLAAAGVFVALTCLAWILWAGLLYSDTVEFAGYDYESDWLERRLFLLYYNFRDMAYYDWFPLWVAVWWGGALLAPFIPRRRAEQQRTKGKKRRKKSAKTPPPPPRPVIIDAAILRWAALPALMLSFNAILSVQAAAQHQIADARYLVAALPFISFMVAVFADWVWEKFGGAVSFAVIAVLLSSNIAAYPLIRKNLLSMEDLRWTLPGVIAEIHLPYPAAVTEIAAYLRENAAPGDTIYVEPWADRHLLMFYLDEYLEFCCFVPPDSPLPKEKIRAFNVPVYQGDARPTWLVRMRPYYELPDLAAYDKVFTGNHFGYPSQRPELEYRLTPFERAKINDVESGSEIYKRKPAR